MDTRISINVLSFGIFFAEPQRKPTEFEQFPKRERNKFGIGIVGLPN